VSDLIQFLSDRDPSPWAELVGFVPDAVTRESLADNHADLLLTSDSKTAVIEVKLGPDSDRWGFLSLSDLVSCWEKASDELARLLAGEAARVLRGWDRMISGVFDTRSAEGWTSLSALTQKFLARVVTRRVAQDLRVRGRSALAGVTSGGGLPLVQGWTPVRGEGPDRTFIAEIRWWETKPGGELRFGVDFDPRPGQAEDEEVRRAAYELARSMDTDINYTTLKGQIAQERPDLAEPTWPRSPQGPQPPGAGPHRRTAPAPTRAPGSGAGRPPRHSACAATPGPRPQLPHPRQAGSPGASAGGTSAPRHRTGRRPPGTSQRQQRP